MQKFEGTALVDALSEDAIMANARLFHAVIGTIVITLLFEAKSFEGTSLVDALSVDTIMVDARPVDVVIVTMVVTTLLEVLSFFHCSGHLRDIFLDNRETRLMF